MKRVLIFVLFLIIIFSFPLEGKMQILKGKMPEKIVVLTFDDAVVSQFTYVAPLLKKHGFGATFYVCEFPPNFSDTTKYMDWHMIQKLDKMGFEIANHTRTHPAVAKLSKEELLKELNYIEDRCEELGIKKPETFAYPGYSISQQVIDVLQEKGYKFARAGGSRVYEPENDSPLLVPSWAMTGENKTQILDALGQAKTGKIVVLTIHGVPDIEHPWVNTPPELFAEVVKYLDENDFTVIALRDLEKYIDTVEAVTELQADLKKPFKN